MFQLSGCSSEKIKDENYLKQEVLSRYKSGIWDTNMVAITEVVLAEKATILISRGKNAQIDLQVQGNMPLSSRDLVNIGANFQIAKESDIATRIIARTKPYATIQGQGN